MGGAGVLRQRGRDQRARLPAARPTVRTRQVQARHKRRVLDGNENIFFCDFFRKLHQAGSRIKRFFSSGE